MEANKMIVDIFTNMNNNKDQHYKGKKQIEDRLNEIENSFDFYVKPDAPQKEYFEKSRDQIKNIYPKG